MGSKEFLEKSKQIVVDYFNSHADKTDQKQIAQDDVYASESQGAAEHNCF